MIEGLLYGAVIGGLISAALFWCALRRAEDNNVKWMLQALKNHGEAEHWRMRAMRAEQRRAA